MTFHILAVASAILLWTSAARAQVVPGAPDPDRVRVRIGPLWLNPTLTLTNAGIDTNVFNTSEADVPERDFTMTVTPRTDVWLRMGRTWLNGIINEDLVWYSRFASQRSANSSYTLNWVVPLTRISFTTGANWLSTKERPGFEIDARVHRRESAYNAAVEVRALSKTLFGIRAEQRKVSYDESAVFRDTFLRAELNRTQTTGALTIRHELTPLTNMTVDVSKSQDRFEVLPLRDSDSTQLGVGIRFDPFALINGSAQIGYRDYKPLDPDTPQFAGATLAMDLSYVALGSTRFAAQAQRDIQYSYDVAQPYYLLSGFSVSIGQQLFGPVDLQARGSWQRMAYRNREGTLLLEGGRTDRVRIYGGGFGYRLGADLRVGFNVEKHRRTSALALHRYEGLRYGMTAAYGG